MTTMKSAVMDALDSFLQYGIDVLPYADDHAWTPDMEARVARLIDAEMKAAVTTPTATMVAVTQELEDAAKANERAKEKFAARHPLAHAALEEAATKMEKEKETGGMGGNDDDDDDDDTEMTRRRCEVGRDADEAAWRNAADAACARLENGRLQLLNLELAVKHGAHGWRAHNAALEQETKEIRDIANRVTKALETMHADRRAEQADAADALYEATRETDTLRQKLREITDAISAAERQIQRQKDEQSKQL